MKKNKDPIVAEVRSSREKVWKDYQRDPEAFRAESEKIRKELGLRRSRLKPIAINLKNLRDRKRRKSAA